MRTTLDIADDVLRTARKRARREKKTTGEVISELVRAALKAGTGETDSIVRSSSEQHPFRPFRRRGQTVTNELIDALRDEDTFERPRRADKTRQ